MMKYFTFRKTFVFSILAFAALTLSFPLFAQEYQDDPRYDRIPQWVYDSLENQREVTATTVVTVDGWDNFKVGLDFAEGHIAENPLQPTEYFNCFNTVAAHYTNDGYNFNNTTVSWGASMWGDPVAAYDSVGNLYFMNMYGSGTIQGCKVAVSDNNGQNWSSVVTAISGIDKNWLCADQTGGPYSNSVYCTMTAGGGGNFSRSTDFGQTFQNTATFGTQGLPGMMPAVGAYGDVQGGAVYVVTNGGSTTSSTYTFYRSINGGASFQQMSSQNWAGYVGNYVNGRHSVENMRTRPYPFIAADNSFGPNRGRLYCVYATNDPPGSGNKPNIYCRHSDDGGSTWSNAVIVNDDFNTQANHQWSPAIWCEKSSGRLYVQWMDTRDCPTSDSCLIYATYSDNGGESFAQNQAISNEKMRINCTTCGGGGTPRYQGDYNGIVSNTSVSMATWADYRDGKFDSYVAYFPDYSMFVSPETLPIEGSDTLYVQFPEVKLYTGSVIVSVQIQNPGAGEFTVSFPNGSILASLPGEVPVVIAASPEVPIGPYLVQVTAKGPNGTPVHKRTSTIDVQPLGPPIADFAADTTEFCAGWGVNYMDMTTNGPSEWEWSFPGGTPETSTDQNPQGIVYSEPGVYSVTLVSSNVAGSDTITKTDYITVNEVPGQPSGEDVTVCASEIVPDLFAEGDNILWYDDPELTNLVNTGNTFVTGITEPGTYPFYATQTLGTCEGEAFIITLTIHALPEVTMEPFEDICLDFGPFELTGGMPEGGEYSGTGVVDGSFDPLVSGTGIFEITYTYTDTNGCTNSTFETIGVNPVPDVDLGPDTDICEGDSQMLTAGPGFASYEWNTGETTESITVTEAGMYSVIVTNDFGCNNFDEVNVNVLPLPGLASQPSGPIEVDNFLEPVSEYATTGTDNADSYFWSIDPVAAGTISGTGLEADVTWSDGYAGTASITVYGINDCGNGEVSDAITVQVYTSQGLDENELGQIRIYPNPNKGTFNLEITTPTEKSLNITMTNSLGEVVFRRDDLRVNGKISETIRTGATSPGMMILQVSDGKNTWQDKVFIEK